MPYRSMRHPHLYWFHQGYILAYFGGKRQPFTMLAAWLWRAISFAVFSVARYDQDTAAAGLRLSSRDCAMPQAPLPPLWFPVDIAGRCFQLLNLDHPQISARIIRDIDAGTAVYYDRRWVVTDRFCRFLLAEPAWVAGRSVMVLGAGVGLETLVIGSLCHRLYINDLSTVALELCAQQLSQNGIVEVTCLPGRYEHLVLPPVDLLVGCFLVYNRDSAAAMQHLLARHTPPVLLMNDHMTGFRTLVRRTSRQVRSLLPPGDIPCFLFTSAA